MSNPPYMHNYPADYIVEHGLDNNPDNVAWDNTQQCILLGDRADTSAFSSTLPAMDVLRASASFIHDSDQLKSRVEVRRSVYNDIHSSRNTPSQNSTYRDIEHVHHHNIMAGNVHDSSFNMHNRINNNIHMHHVGSHSSPIILSRGADNSYNNSFSINNMNNYNNYKTNYNNNNNNNNNNISALPENLPDDASMTTSVGGVSSIYSATNTQSPYRSTTHNNNNTNTNAANSATISRHYQAPSLVHDNRSINSQVTQNNSTINSNINSNNATNRNGNNNGNINSLFNHSIYNQSSANNNSNNSTTTHNVSNGLHQPFNNLNGRHLGTSNRRNNFSQIGTSTAFSRGNSMHTTSQYNGRLKSNVTKFTQNGERIINEYVNEIEHTIPKKVYIEETRMIPETRLIEKVVEETVKRKRRVVEIEKPVYVEKIVEVPEVHYSTVIVPKKEKVTQENIVQVPKIEYMDRVIEVPRVVIEHKYIEVPVLEYIEVEYETIVEVPEIITETIIVEKPVPQYIEVDVPHIVDVEVEEHTDVNIPLPLNHVTDMHLEFPKIKPTYKQLDIPVYVPRFIEISLPVDMIDDLSLLQAQETTDAIAALQAQGPVSLQEMEVLVRQVMRGEALEQLKESTAVGAWTENWMKSQIPTDFSRVIECMNETEELVNKL